MLTGVGAGAAGAGRGERLQRLGVALLAGFAMHLAFPRPGWDLLGWVALGDVPDRAGFSGMSLLTLSAVLLPLSARAPVPPGGAPGSTTMDDGRVRTPMPTESRKKMPAGSD